MPVAERVHPGGARAAAGRGRELGSDLCVLPWQDVLGTRERINLPGSMSDANWAYRITQNVDQLLEDAQSRDAAQRLAWLTASARR